MISYELNQHERIIKAKVDLNKNRPFFAYLLMHMEIEKTKSTKDVPTLAINQYGNLYWNEDFTSKLTNDELQAVLCHEVMHISTLTFQRKGRRDMGLWNIATDLVINWMLIQERFVLPKDCLKPDHRGIYTFNSHKTKKQVHIDLNEKVAEQVYDELIKNAKIVKEATACDGDGNYIGGFDKHLESDKDSEGKSNGKGKGDGAANKNESDWKRKIIESSTAAKMRGAFSAEMERMIGSILEPVVDWRHRLFSYITNELPIDFTMRMPSRRFISTGVYTPQIIKENLEVIVGVDISGSIGGEEFNEFLAEVIGIADSYRQIKMRVIGWAHEVLESDDILITNDTKDNLPKMKFKGGGGTTFSCFTEYCEKKEYKSRIYVVLTDGYIETTPKVPANGNILWVVSKNGQKDVVKNYGEVTTLNDVKR